MRLAPIAVPTIALTLAASAWLCAQSQQNAAPPASQATATSASASQPAAPAASAFDATTLPFHDTHQSFTVAADPILKADEYKSRFGKKNPYDTGIIAIDAYFRNDSARPVQIVLDDIRLTVAAQGEEQQDLPPLSSREVASDTLHEGEANGAPPSRRRLPPIPGTAANHGKEWQELESRLRIAQIPSDIVAPHSTVHGLLYFDIDSRFDLISVCRLYVPNLKIYGSDQALLYFEVPLSATKSK
jgi:hypothetical protein